MASSKKEKKPTKTEMKAAVKVQEVREKSERVARKTAGQEAWKKAVARSAKKSGRLQTHRKVTP